MNDPSAREQRIILDRVSTAAEDSPLAVWAVPADAGDDMRFLPRFGLRAAFAATVGTAKAIRRGDPTLVGVFTAATPRASVERALRDAAAGGPPKSPHIPDSYRQKWLT